MSSPSNNSVDYVLRLVAEGNGAQVTKQQYEELKKAEKDLASASDESSKRRKQNVTELIKAVEQLNPGIKSQVEETKKSTEAQKDDTAQTDKAADAKQKLRDGLKGLAVEFPMLARVMGLAVNPISALVTAVSVLIGVLRDLSAEREAVAA